MSDNLYPQFQVQVREHDKKTWETIYYDPELDVLQMRFKYQVEIRPRGVWVRLLGLKGENLDQAEGAALDTKKKVAETAE